MLLLISKVRFSFSSSYLLSSIEYPQLVSSQPSLHCTSHHSRTNVTQVSTRSLLSTKGNPDGVCFNTFFEINTVSYLILLLLPTKIPVSTWRKVRSLIKPIQPWTTAGKKKTKKRHAFANRVSDPYKKKRDEQENGVGDIIDQPTNKIKRRGSH